ncbi:MAG: flagellar biosynthetic protein FliR [Rhodobacterales bacterium]|nr:flagellar biosynthetic protein FliR [Rhodobacterales bacterium]
MLSQILSMNIFAFFMVFARMGTAIALMPGFSAAYISMRVRLGVGLAVAFVSAPMVSGGLPPQPASVAGLFALLGGEILVGAFLGSLMRVLVGALQTAGTLISYFSSLANAFVQDPIAEQQSSTIAGFLSLVGILMVFATGSHHLMLRAAIDSYGLFTPGAAPPMGDMAEVMSRAVADSFALGLQMSAPFLISGLTYYVGIGLLGRLMPSLPVFFFGLPVQITVQFFIVIMTLSAMMMAFLTHFNDGLGAYLAP